MTSIHEALFAWFLNCANIAKLFFSFGDESDGATVISTAGDTIQAAYIDGSAEHQYTFDLIRYVPIDDTPNDATNAQMLADVDAIVEWAIAQSDSGNLPDLPEGMNAESIEVLDSAIGYAVDVDTNIAKYSIPFAMNYYKEG